mmetsp:Transcript_8868/g.14855  ORF Transcript_8868/g.14855 Transcript_8868/m.14855 type:complete len:270 (-) Transcript_8868:725-1534(-)
MRLLVHFVTTVLLDVRVNDRHHLASGCRQLILHLFRVGELELVPREVSLPIRVFDVEPEHIVRQVERLELSVHILDVSIVVVIPSALVVAEGEKRWQRGHPRELGILCKDFHGGGSGQHHDVNDARFAHPVSGCGLGALTREPAGRFTLLTPDVDEGFGRVKPEGTESAIGRMGQHQWHPAVQGHWRIEFVVVHVERPQPIGLLVFGSRAGGRGKIQRPSMLGKAKNMRSVDESHVHPDRGRPERFRIEVRAEVLFPLAIVLLVDLALV